MKFKYFVYWLWLTCIYCTHSFLFVFVTFTNSTFIRSQTQLLGNRRQLPTSSLNLSPHGTHVTLRYNMSWRVVSQQRRSASWMLTTARVYISNLPMPPRRVCNKDTARWTRMVLCNVAIWQVSIWCAVWCFEPAQLLAAKDSVWSWSIEHVVWRFE